MRHTDQAQKHYFRAPERVFHMNGAWFFAAREGDQGPYPSHREAELEVARFICAKTELANFQNQRERGDGNVAKFELEPLELELEPLSDNLPTRAAF